MIVVNNRLLSGVPVSSQRRVRISNPRLSSMSVDVDGKTAPSSWEDEFSYLHDRRDLTPLSLPDISARKRVVLVRHGQSTWNAEGRIQGSTDFAVLTELGKAQAETTRQMVCSWMIFLKNRIFVL